MVTSGTPGELTGSERLGDSWEVRNGQRTDGEICSLGTGASVLPIKSSRSMYASE